jgi:3-isopropylmalate/(R)-2-methylmalate dehydratase small subunit
MAQPVTDIAGRGCVLRGNDIDTDRIIPARHLRELTFEPLGRYAFEDDRKAAGGKHALDDDRFEGAEILIVGKNFGCGSSREHAPQSLMRFGFRAFVGESFAEIFFGNCTTLGLPCVTLGAEEIETLRVAVEVDPSQTLRLDLAGGTLRSSVGAQVIDMPAGTRKTLVEGTWDATAVLLDAGDAIEATAARLPYIGNFTP